MHSFEVHSNESACRKKVFLGLEQVIKLVNVTDKEIMLSLCYSLKLRMLFTCAEAVDILSSVCCTYYLRYKKIIAYMTGVVRRIYAIIAL